MSQASANNKATSEMLTAAGLNPCYMACSVLVAQQRINEIKRNEKGE